MVGAAARQQDEGEDRRRRRRRTDPSESLVVIGRHRRYGVSVRARGGKRAGALRGEPCQLFPSCSWVSGVARNLTGSRLRGDGERGDLRDTHRPPPPYLCNSRCQATVVITSPSVCNGRPLADSCYAVDLVIPKTRARDRARPPLPARISSRRRPNVMDGTCLYQFVTTPIKNVLQLQRIKEWDYFLFLRITLARGLVSRVRKRCKSLRECRWIPRPTYPEYKQTRSRENRGVLSVKIHLNFKWHFEERLASHFWLKMKRKDV